MKKENESSVEIEVGNVPPHVIKEANADPDNGPRYIIAGDKAYRRRQGIWQGDKLYHAGAPGAWFVEDAPESGVVHDQPGFEHPAPVAETEADKSAKKKAKAEAEAEAEAEADKPAKPAAKSGPQHVDMLSEKDTKAQMKGQAQGNKF